MANLAVLDASSNTKYLKESGAGTDVDPHIGHIESAQLPAALAAGGGLKVEGVAGGVTVPISDGAGSITVDDGATTLSIDDGGGSITVDGTVSATVSSTDDCITVTLSLDTNAYASGDVLAELQAVANAVVNNGGKALLHSITVLDEDDQKASIEIVFSNSATASLGSENAAVSISDADARTILGIVQVAASDYLDYGGCSIATKTNLGLLLEAGAATTSLYVGAVIRGAATYTASGIQLILGLLSRT